MKKRVLVAIDDSGPATAALEYALSRFSTADITVLHVLNIVDADDMRQRVLATDCDEQRDAAEHTAETVLRTARTYAEASGTEITTTTTTGRPARQILAYTEENDIERIVMGTHGRSGLARLLLGSLSDLVSGQSSVPVTSVPNQLLPNQRELLSERTIRRTTENRMQARGRSPHRRSSGVQTVLSPSTLD